MYVVATVLKQRSLPITSQTLQKGGKVVQDFWSDISPRNRQQINKAQSQKIRMQYWKSENYLLRFHEETEPLKTFCNSG